VVKKGMIGLIFVLCGALGATQNVQDPSTSVELPYVIQQALKEGPIDPVVAFNELRLRNSTKAVNAFLEFLTPRDVLACMKSLALQLDRKPTTLERSLWDSLMRVLEAHVVHLEKMYVVAEDQQVFFHKKNTQKKPENAVPFFDWWKKVDQDSYVSFFGLYFDYHLIGIRSIVMSAWEMVDPSLLYSNSSLRLALKALEQSVNRFIGIAKFHGYYERTTKKANEFVTVMRKRISDRKYSTGPVSFGGAKSLPRTSTAYGLVDKAFTNGALGSFCESFLSSYGICLHERYGHEYHEYLLEHTACSYQELEHAFVDKQLKIDGRIMIVGYEGGAFDSYFSNFNDLLGDALCDETAFRGNSGWSKPPANYFGFLTAFALRDANNLSKNGLFEHIHENSVELFNKVFELLQRDSFTRLYAFVRAHEESARPKIQMNDVTGVLKGFVTFFDFLYEDNLVLADGQSVATQDILFNRKHVQQLTRSTVPTLKFYTGADVTYPILPTKQRNSFATHHAQEFVRKFVKHLVPREDEPTVYVFNSFVDGVGKSTMLGNIKNWIKHGDAMDQYEVTDNTSSQLADIFEFSKDVYIADLPAQISHFTFKPDGYVYVDVTSVKGQEELSKRILAYFDTHKDELVAAYRKRLQEVAGIIAQEGWHTQILNSPNNPRDAFLKNLHLLKLAKTNPWIPCEFEGQHYLIDETISGEVRTFMSLSEAQSSGLKNVRADQMFFFDGVTMPLEYKVFLDDLTTRCLERGVKRVCFVDFLSMYMRSSRENIRVNYLMQQMALLFNDFNQQDTVYRDLTGNPELLYLLQQDTWFSKVSENLKRETMVRWGLHAMLQEQKGTALRKIPFKESTARIQQMFDEMQRAFVQSLEDASLTRMQLAAKNLVTSCGKSKEFVNIQSISWPRILSLAKKLQKIMTGAVANKSVKEIWSSFGAGDIVDDEEKIVFGPCDRLLKTTDGKVVRVRFAIDPADRNSVIIRPVFRILRTLWYNTLFQLLGAQTTKNRKLHLPQPFPVLPWTVKMGTNGNIYVIQPHLPVFDGDIPEEYSKENNNLGHLARCIDFDTTQWVEVQEELFAIDVKEMLTTSQEYGFGSEETVTKEVMAPAVSTRITTKVLAEYVRKFGQDDVCMLQDIVPRMQEHLSPKILKEIEALVREGKRQDEQDLKGKEGQPVYLDEVDSSLYWGLELFLVHAAQLEQVVRDPDATLAVRCGNRKDVEGALWLLEKVVVPQYFGLVSRYDLYAQENILKQACLNK